MEKEKIINGKDILDCLTMLEKLESLFLSKLHHINIDATSVDIKELRYPNGAEKVREWGIEYNFRIPQKMRSDLATYCKELTKKYEKELEEL